MIDAAFEIGIHVGAIANEIDGALKCFFEIGFDVYHGEQVGYIQFEDDIDIACGGGFVAGEGAENTGAGYAIFLVKVGGDFA